MPSELGAAIDYLNQLGTVNIERYEHQLTEYGTERLQTVPGLRLIGTAPHKVGVLSFIVDNIPYKEVGKRLASEGIAVRADHHCAQPYLHRYGLTGTVRPSLAFYKTQEELDTLYGIRFLKVYKNPHPKGWGYTDEARLRGLKAKTDFYNRIWY